MTEEFIIELMQSTIGAVALLVAPTIIVIVVIGIVANIIQTVTQIRDQAITFVPKVIGVAIILVVSIPWTLQIMKQYTETVFQLMQNVAQ